MSTNRGDMPAIPVMDEAPEHGQHYGMNIREQMAMAAMQGILANPTGQQEPEGAPPEAVIQIVALASVNFADALLAELENSK